MNSKLVWLIEQFESTVPYTRADYDQLSQRRRNIAMEMLNSGKSYGQAAATHPVFSMGQEQFFSHLSDIKDDLSAQTDILCAMWQDHRERGEPVAPHYAMRVAIILRREKQMDLERRFLSAWCRHFPRNSGSMYAKLSDRHRKVLGR